MVQVHFSYIGNVSIMSKRSNTPLVLKKLEANFTLCIGANQINNTRLVKEILT